MGDEWYVSCPRCDKCFSAFSISRDVLGEVAKNSAKRKLAIHIQNDHNTSAGEAQRIASFQIAKKAISDRRIIK